MEESFMTPNGSEVKISDLDSLQLVPPNKQSSSKVRTESTENHVTERRLLEMAADGVMSAGSGGQETSAMLSGVNGEIGMELKTRENSVEPVFQHQPATEVGNRDSKENDQSKSGVKEVASLPSSSENTSIGDQTEVVMDIDAVSCSSQEYHSAMTPFFGGGESETTDSRDSLSVAGTEVEAAMEVDVMASASQNHSKIDNSDDTETIASIDSQRSDELQAKSGMQKRPPKPKSTPWIPLDNLPLELDHGYRILRDLMGDRCKSFNWPFLDPVDTEALGLWDYHDKIKQPMWLRKIQFKFVDGVYQSITEFVHDVRVLLENCYRYNGMKHWVSKQAQTLESTLQQKLTLLPRDLQEKTTLYVTSKGKYGAEGVSTSTSSGRRRFSGKFSQSTSDYNPLATSIRKDLEETDRENKRQQIINRKEEIAQYYVDLIDWEKELMQEGGAKYMGYIWEIPFIGHFLYMCQSVLCLEEVSFYELERAFAAPRESSLLRKIFTSLLCSPYQRTRLEKKPAMPYKVWEAKLREQVRYWYSLVEEEESVEEASESLGIPLQFFEVLGSRFFMDHKRYHELSFYERVWVMKALCDYIYETQSVIKKTIDAQPINDQRQMVLGYDRDNNAYIHFPQFCGADLRIYRQAAFPEPVIKPKIKPKEKTETQESQEVVDQAKSESGVAEPPKPATPPPPPPPRARPSRLRKKINPVLRHGINSESELKQAEFSKKDKEEDKTNGEIEAEEDCSTTLKERTEIVQKDEQETEKKLQNDAEVFRTDTSKVMDENSCMSESGNDNNSNNRKLPEEEPSSSSVIQSFKDGSIGDSGMAKSEHVVVQEQTDVGEICDGTPGNGTSNVDKDQALSGDPDKNLSQSRVSSLEDATGADKDVKLPVVHEDQKSVPSEDVTEKSVDRKELSPNAQNTLEISRTKGEQTSQSQDVFSNADTSRLPDASGESQTPSGSNQPDTPPESQETAVTDEQSKQMNGKVTNSEQSALSSPEPATTSQICWSPPRPSTPLPDREEVLPSVDEFELVCDTVEDLRGLIKKFSGEPEEIVIPAKGKKKKKTIITKPVRRKHCEIELHQKLSNLLLELEPWEGKLIKVATRTREKLSKEVNYYQPPDTNKVIKDIWASEESSSESESESSDSDSESDSDDDSSSSQEMATEDAKADVKAETETDKKTEAKKQEDADMTHVIVESVLEHEIPARRTRLARKRHIHMLKSAKKAAAKAAANKSENNNNSEAGGGSNEGEEPSKKPRVSKQSQKKTTCQPVRATLGNGPGSLSASLPLYSVLQSSNLLNTSAVPQGTLRMPAQSQAASASQNLDNKPAAFGIQQTGVSSSQPSILAKGQTPAAAVLTKTAAGSSVRYLSLQDLAKINPALAQTITSMSVQQQQQQQHQASTSGNATKQVPQSLGAVPGVTCIMKTVTSSASTAQPASGVTVSKLAQEGPGGVGGGLSITTVNSTVSSATPSTSYLASVENSPSFHGLTEVGVQQTVMTSSGSNLVSAVNPRQYVATNPVNNNAALSRPVETVQAMQGSVNSLSQTVQLHQTSVPGTSCTVLPTIASTVATTQVASSIPSMQPVTAMSGNINPTTQPVSVNTLSSNNTVPSAISLDSGMPMQQLLRVNNLGNSGKVSQPGLMKTNPVVSSVTPAPAVGQSSTAKTTYTITVDAKIWKQLQGKPHLQQQLVLNHIHQKQMQQQQQLLQQQMLQQQQQPAHQNKIIMSPVKAALQNNPRPRMQMSQQLQLMQQQIAQQSTLTTSPSNTALQSNVQHQQLLQQSNQQSKVVVNPQQLLVQQQLQQQVKQQVQQHHPQPAKEIIKMPLSPVKSTGPQTNVKQAALQTGNTLHFTHTQQTQQSNLASIPQSSQQQGQMLSSPMQINLPIQSTQGNQKPSILSVPLSTALSTASIQQQLLHLQQQQQTQGKSLTLSPTKGVVLQPMAATGQKPGLVTVPTSTPATTSIQNLSQLTHQQRGGSLTLSPNKQVILQQKLPGNPNPNMVTVPLSMLLKQVQQQQGKPSFVYVLPTASSAQATTQGSQGIVVQGTASLTQPSQGSQSVVTVPSTASLTQFNQGSQSNPMQNAPLLTQSNQGMQSITMQSLSSLIQGQRVSPAAQSRSIVQLLQQTRGQQNASVLLSGAQNPTQGAAQVVAPTSLGLSNITVQQPTSTVIAPGAMRNVEQPELVSGAQNPPQRIAQFVAPASLGQSSSTTQQPEGGIQTVQAVPPDNTRGVEQPKQALSDEEKTAQQTFQ